MVKRGGARDARRPVRALNGIRSDERRTTTRLAGVAGPSGGSCRPTAPDEVACVVGALPCKRRSAPNRNARCSGDPRARRRRGLNGAWARDGLSWLRSHATTNGRPATSSTRRFENTRIDTTNSVCDSIDTTTGRRTLPRLASALTTAALAGATARHDEITITGRNIARARASSAVKKSLDIGTEHVNLTGSLQQCPCRLRAMSPYTHRYR
jgi:hypothetical protein